MDTSALAPIDVALVGYGLAGSVFHAPLITATPGLRLAAVVTTTHAAEASRTLPGVEVVSRAEDLWSRRGRFGLVVVATPHRTHLPITMAALEAGAAVVVDKPMAVRAIDAQQMVDEAARRGLVLSVFHNRRWDGDFLTLRHLIENDSLGAVWRFESRFERWRQTPKAGWRDDPDPDAGGGVLLNLGPHLVDQALQLFGPVKRVHAEIDCRRPGAQTPDDTFLALEHESGVHSHLWMNEVAGRMGPRFRVLGSKGAYVKRGLDPQEEMLRTGCKPHDGGFGEETAAGWGTLSCGRNSRPVPTEAGNYVRFYEQMVEAVRSNGPVPVDPVDGVRALQIIETATAAAWGLGR